MNMDKMIDLLGQIDEDMIRQVEELRSKSKKPAWIRWAAMAASIALIVSAGWYVWEHVLVAYRSTSLIERGVYVNSAFYMPDAERTQVATEDNAGEFVGYVSLDNKKETEIPAYRYVPGDGEIARIIIPQRSKWYVYAFREYVPDGTDDWPEKILKNAAHVEVWTGTAGAADPTVLDETHSSQLLSLFSGLGEKHNQEEINQRIYERFKDRFSKGAIWLGDDGRIYYSNTDISLQLSGMLHKDGREIIVVMNDHTRLYYNYLPAAGLITVYDGYFLSETQVEQINKLVGLE